MPIVDTKKTAPPVEKPAPVQIAAPSYKGVTVDTRYIPSSSLLTYVEGSPWTVNYFSQVVDQDSELKGNSPTLDPLYQQYSLVKGFEMRVTTPLTSSQETDSNAMVVTGNATVYPFLIPNFGDMFLADIGDGREGIFKVTNVERKTIFKDACHAIEYQLIAYSTKDRIADLMAKVVKKVVFVKDFLTFGQNPLLQEEDVAIVEALQRHYKRLTNYYFKMFMSREFRTLVLPGQSFPGYDHFLTKFVMGMFTTYDAPEIREIKILNCDGDKVMHATQLWDVLRARDPYLLQHAFRHAGLVSTRTFEKNPMLEGIYHSGIWYVVYPKDPELAVDYNFVARTKTLSNKTLKATQLPVINTPAYATPGATKPTDIDFDPLPPGDTSAIPDLIHPVLVDECYVLSEAFYTNAELGQSKLELAVRDYLNGKALDNKTLLALCEAQHQWGGLERFYYVPIILTLIKASIRSI